MGFEINEVVLYSRGFHEYRSMFNLTKKDFKRSILSVADGPASFHAKMAEKGVHITSLDPVYGCSPKDIERRFYETFDDIFMQIKRESDADPSWCWSFYDDAYDMKRRCEKSFHRFMDEYRTHKKRGYIAGAMPHLPFPDASFDLVICSHFLFLYSHVLDKKFHWHCIREMLRVGREIRVYPLHMMDSSISGFLDPIMAKLVAHGFQVELVPVDYQVRERAHKMLRVCHR
ncbi:Uncharacterised protein [BD1-7 clade bacterium]|uniref:Methyltransferase type 11 domain-containing protein n=1 Tax=BD1-7 clade bacterium TaxID=2029982 RepID=A0A5S9QRK9_9GAMM|nr:Uncharacterised protein [BD1-7 clade bacterium]